MKWVVCVNSMRLLCEVRVKKCKIGYYRDGFRSYYQTLYLFNLRSFLVI